ncbi:hypothetical protein CSH63_22775 [Micromonospora tulbaghiae]|jgi:hypothetical protein|uniref:Uncharacterized protein n=1 Tax=Micromonospora tulbaghiae TaxID=479978 RepID=A0A386WQQ0_9ACTN|nr:hypothetical protein CSH63_22775 [Micromonospora tulbaghiae]
MLPHGIARAPERPWSAYRLRTGGQFWRLKESEEVEEPLGEQGGSRRFVRRQGGVGEQVLTAEI